MESITDERVVASNVDKRILCNENIQHPVSASSTSSRVPTRNITSANSGRAPCTTLTYTMFGSVQKGRRPASSRDAHHLGRNARDPRAHESRFVVGRWADRPECAS